MIRRSTEAQPERRAVRLQRQRRGDRRAPSPARFFPDPATRRLPRRTPSPSHILMKVETHNHPTAISPYPGAATGSGGEIRDEGATGRGAKPKAGLVGFIGLEPAPARRRAAVGARLRQARRASRRRSTSCSRRRSAAPRSTTSSADPRWPATSAPSSWTSPPAPPPASARRTRCRGYHKPIMLAGGLGNIRADHVKKDEIPAGAPHRRARRPGDADRPRRRRGVVGGVGRHRTRISISPRCSATTPRCSAAARRSSTAAGRWATTTRSCRSTTSAPAGCRTRCPSWCNDSGRGARFELRKIPSDEPGMSPLEIWCNEAQERYVLAHRPAERLDALRGAVRARALPVRGARPGDRGRARWWSTTPHFANRPIDMPLGVLLGKPPAHDAARPTTRESAREPFDVAGLDLREARAARAAPADRRRQDLPGHHRRSHRRRAGRARPDGRPVAGAGGRRGRHRRRASTSTRARRWRWASARRSRCSTPRRRRAWRSPRRSPTSRRRPIARSRRRQAVGELDGRRRAPGRGRAPLRRGARRRRRAVPRAGHRDPGRQGLDVDAHGVAAGRRDARGDRAAVADRQRVRAGDRRARAR